MASVFNLNVSSSHTPNQPKILIKYTMRFFYQTCSYLAVVQLFFLFSPLALFAQKASKSGAKKAGTSAAMHSMAGHNHAAMMAAMPATKKLAPAQPTEGDYYQILPVSAPDGELIEVGGLAMMPDGRLAVCTRRGDVYLISNPGSEASVLPAFQRFATGLHEPLGLAYHQGALYCSQRGGLTKLVDTDGDQVADIYENVCTYPLSANYHEYAYGPTFDAEGNAYISLNVGFFDPKWYLGVAAVPFRGWVLKIKPDGSYEPFAAGVRSPAGIMITSSGKLIYGENQGDFVGSGWVTELKKGDFAGHPASLAWAAEPNSPVLARPGHMAAADGRMMLKAKDTIPGLKLPAVWFPQGIMGVSTCGLMELPKNDLFGPYGGQFLVGDQGQSKLMRMTLDDVDGTLQGACYDFRKGFLSGVLRMVTSPDGTVYVGQTSRGWSAEGKESWALQAVVYRGGTPFEIKKATAMPDGFDLELTRPVDLETAQSFASYGVTSFGYKYHPTYGSPVIGEKEHRILGIVASPDGLHVRLVVDSLRPGYIHELKAEGLRDPEGQPLLHSVAYYTLNKIPTGDKIALGTLPPAPKLKPTAVPTPSQANALAKEPSAIAKAATTKTAPKAAPALPVHLNTMPAAWGGKADVSLSLTTKTGLKFEPAQLEVKAGARVRLTFQNPDDMLHNFVLTTPGNAVPVGEAAMKLGLKGMSLNYVPTGDKRVLAHTYVTQPQDAETIYFVAPAKKGSYPYVCTLPGHFYSMQGVLIVR